MSIKKPWLMLEQCHPVEARDVLWMDWDGSYHLGPQVGELVRPRVYSESFELALKLRDFSCWREIETCDPANISHPWVDVERKLPDEGEEVLWVNCDGLPHLGRRRGRKVSMAVYGGADDIDLPISNFACWQSIQAPEEDLADA